MARDRTSIELDSLPHYVGYQVRQAQTAVFRDIEFKMRGIGVNPGDFGLLTIVNGNPGINQKSLAELYRLDKSTLSYAVKRLVERRWIRRRRDRKDKRFYGLWLTEVGENILGQATARIEAQEDLIDTALGPGERSSLIDMLGRITRVLNGE
ncbi:MAG: MarR family winged helix-turn-helix transcriptional regulator [Rhodospirillales bacterium]|jgi:DNA-binding MarR family transcriptional regulator|nr:hypothetical protein [Rhodospirillaceae bacterium]MDP6426627.1 MarR family winged helix-turn-helix transcriptional regulator [Rhodospirillales bacterium]MDP6644673.1 MarR family winged helix-turn-helix transcriptional regulator [Rhodospirillales bacterium]MDP6842248.1 MarR family winged helix-turn-helix transcriptional regulator [Rhodospirillales bacterium]|tara:strand:- start:223 stop:678 length:456 start_codon:yes stop_codon:yes gene_type:complete